MTSHYLLNSLQSVPLSSATEEQASILNKAQKQVGFIPNMYAIWLTCQQFLTVIYTVMIYFVNTVI